MIKTWIFLQSLRLGFGQLSFINSHSLRNVDAIEAGLYYATEEVLITIGESTRQALLWHFRNEHIPYSLKAMDMVQIESKLRQFFGSASPVIIQMIYDKFMLRAARKGYFSSEMISMLDKLPKNANTETILRLAGKINRVD